LQAEPENLAALNNLAIIYANQKQPLLAISYLEKVAALDSGAVWPFINLGLYHTETGNYPAALANFDYALTITDSEPLIYSNRGHLYYKLGDYTKAIKDLNRSIEKYPTNSYAYRNRALVYIAMNKKEEACRDLDASIYNGFTKQYGDEVKKLSRKHCR
jgi:tetratricopeptide (TPR) repeat protein